MRSGNDLDRVDLLMLGLLHHSGRMSNKELAGAVGLAPSTCLDRMRRLIKLGVLKGFHAEVDYQQLGIGLQGMISVRLRKHSRELVESFRDHVLTLPEVCSIYHVAGGDDFLVQVAVKDADHLRDLALDAFTTRSEVDHIETRLIFQHTSTWRLPIFHDSE